MEILIASSSLRPSRRHHLSAHGRSGIEATFLKTLCLILMSFYPFLPSGEACDFENEDQTFVRVPTNKDPCELWERPEASDGTTGFYLTRGFEQSKRPDPRGPLYDASKMTKYGE